MTHPRLYLTCSFSSLLSMLYWILSFHFSMMTSQIALPAFLASATGAKCALSCILPEDYLDASFEKALNLWLTKANLSEAPSDFIQKHWRSPLGNATFDQLITDLDVENVKRLNAYQDLFGSAWLNVVPSKILGLKFTDQQLRISLSLRLGSKICENHLLLW